MVRILYTKEEREEMEKEETNRKKPKKSFYQKLKTRAIKSRAKYYKTKHKIAREKAQWTYIIRGKEGVKRLKKKEILGKKYRNKYGNRQIRERLKIKYDKPKVNRVTFKSPKPIFGELPDFYGINKRRKK